MLEADKKFELLLDSNWFNKKDVQLTPFLLEYLFYRNWKNG